MNLIFGEHNAEQVQASQLKAMGTIAQCNTDPPIVDSVTQVLQFTGCCQSSFLAP